MNRPGRSLVSPARGGTSWSAGSRPDGRHEGGVMKITGVELRTIRMPLRSPFETSFGVEEDRVAVLIWVVGAVPSHDHHHPHPVEVQGWGECVAMEFPLYSSEYAEGAAEVLRRFLIPRLLA